MRPPKPACTWTIQRTQTDLCTYWYMTVNMRSSLVSCHSAPRGGGEAVKWKKPRNCGQFSGQLYSTRKMRRTLGWSPFRSWLAARDPACRCVMLSDGTCRNTDPWRDFPLTGLPAVLCKSPLADRDPCTDIQTFRRSDRGNKFESHCSRQHIRTGVRLSSTTSKKK
jgi:hypothetical protein